MVAELIDQTAQHASESAFFFDFDGTVANIQDDPATVQLVPEVKEALALLTNAIGRVCVVSARPVAFLRPRFEDIPAIRLYGQYGLESYKNSTLVTDPEAERFRSVIVELTRRANAELPPQVLVEEQGFRLSLHYRRLPSCRAEIEEWAQQAAAATGAMLQEGRMVVELKPPVKRNKGDIVLAETEDSRVGWYFGDDLSDLMAFRALRTRTAEDSDFLGVAVAVRNTESGDQVAAEADMVLNAPLEVADLIRQVLDAIAVHSLS